MKIAAIADVKANLSTYVKVAKEELVVITRNGKPVAVLLPIEEEDDLERLVLAYSKRFQGLLAEARTQIKTTGGISHTEFWHDIEENGADQNISTVRTQEPD
jgi:prevent-host-death family protein